jgi:hypothetical protein
VARYSNYAGFKSDLFLAKIEHSNDNADRALTIRPDHGGNIYSFVGPMGEYKAM